MRLRCPTCGSVFPLVPALGKAWRDELKLQEHEPAGVSRKPLYFNHCAGSGLVITRGGKVHDRYTHLEVK